MGRLRRKFQEAYSRMVGLSRKRPRVEPVRHLPELDGYAGLWVGVKDGQIGAAGQTSTEVAEILFRKNIHGAVIQYVPHPSNAEKVGLG